MLRFLFKKTKKIDGDEYPSNDFRSLWSDFEKSIYNEKEQYRAMYEQQNKQLLDALEWNEKFKGVMERLREEKWELEMENEFLRKKVKECQ